MSCMLQFLHFQKMSVKFDRHSLTHSPANRRSRLSLRFVDINTGLRDEKIEPSGARKIILSRRSFRLRPSRFREFWDQPQEA